MNEDFEAFVDAVDSVLYEHAVGDIGPGTAVARVRALLNQVREEFQ